MTRYDKLKKILEDCKAGKIDESKLEIQLDNDQTCIYLGNDMIFEGEGYYDIEFLYPLLFPKAEVGRA